MQNRKGFSKVLLSIGLLAIPLNSLAAEITGAGSTFVYPVLAKWSTSYHQATGHKVNYQSIGSGGGIAQIKAGTVDFGASDKPLAPEELATSGLGQFPVVIGGVVPVVNIKGLAPGSLKFTGAVLADIFLGKIDRWDADVIKALNPGAALPNAKITVVHRSDGSGTTFNFANYLSKVSPEWKNKVGEGTSLSWPTGVGGKGNEGVAAYVAQLPNSIGYVEYAYALQAKLNYAAVQNREGEFVQPSAESFQAAAASADWANAKDFHLVMTDAPGKGSYPITATVFVIMYKKPKDAEKSKLALSFFRHAFAKGQAEAKALDYVPLPEKLTATIDTYWRSQFVSAH